MDWAFDLAGVVGLLGFLATGTWTLWGALRDADGSRESLLTQREQEHDAAVDRELRELREQLNQTDRTNKALLGTLAVLIDHFVMDERFSPALSMLAINLRMAFPSPDETPADLAVLLRRLDARNQGKEP